MRTPFYLFFLKWHLLFLSRSGWLYVWAHPVFSLTLLCYVSLSTRVMWHPPTTVKESFRISAFISIADLIPGVEDGWPVDPHSRTLLVFYSPVDVCDFTCSRHLRRFLWEEYELNKGNPAKMATIQNTINVFLYVLWAEIFIILYECVILFSLCVGVFKPVCMWEFLSLISCTCVL